MMSTKALLVDDDRSSALATGRLLESQGCSVEICSDAMPAALQAIDDDYDVVCLDLSMPHRDGYEVLTLIRSHEHTRRTPSVPVMAVTARSSPSDRAETLAVGFAGHLAKPVRLADVTAMLDRVSELRDPVMQSRYSSDHHEVVKRIEAAQSETAPEERIRVLAGLALAVEQRARQCLQRGLEACYAGDRAAIRAAARALGSLAESLGARALLSHAAAIERAAEGSESEIERCAVLARRELERLLFTIRERVLM